MLDNIDVRARLYKKLDRVRKDDVIKMFADVYCAARNAATTAEDTGVAKPYESAQMQELLDTLNAYNVEHSLEPRMEITVKLNVTGHSRVPSDSEIANTLEDVLHDAHYQSGYNDGLCVLQGRAISDSVDIEVLNVVDNS